MIKEIIKSTCKFIFDAAMFVLLLLGILFTFLISIIILVVSKVCQAISNAASNLFSKMCTPDHEVSNLNKGHFSPSPSSKLSSTQAAYSHISNAEEAGDNNLEVHHTDKKIDLVAPA